MLKFIGVSRSGYNAWLQHVSSDTEKRRKALKAKIQDIYDDFKQNYGASNGNPCPVVQGMEHHHKRFRFQHGITKYLDEQFNPDRPNAVRCSDITYIWITDGFVYLTSIMNLYSRKIIAWTHFQKQWKDPAL